MGLTIGLLQGLNKLTYAKYLDECLSHSEHYRLAIVIVIMDLVGGRSAARTMIGVARVAFLTLPLDRWAILDTGPLCCSFLKRKTSKRKKSYTFFHWDAAKMKIIMHLNHSTWYSDVLWSELLAIVKSSPVRIHSRDLEWQLLFQLDSLYDLLPLSSILKTVLIRNLE